MVTTEATRTNEQVRHDVQAELKWYAGVEHNGIGAAVKDGIVILGGWGDSYLKSWEAERAAVAGGDGAFGGQVFEGVAHLGVERVGCFSAHVGLPSPEVSAGHWTMPRKSRSAVSESRTRQYRAANSRDTATFVHHQRIAA